MSREDNTREFLKCISNHLSSRKCCKGIMYNVEINKKGIIHFTPNIFVYPSRYKRRQEDKTPVLSHILSTDFKDIVISNEDNIWVIDIDKIVPGRYVYQISYNRKSRRWFKEREC